MSFGYDANGRMVKAARENQPDALSVYDSLGNRVATKTNDVWQFVIYDAFGKLIAEYGGMQSSDEGGVKYVLSDWQGSIRAILNNAGFGQSRTDYTSFGEEINAGIGLRTQAQGFGVSNQTRQGYGLTEKDETGLNHTWFRKNENKAGRWTSPDPYNGSASIDNPQSWNRYSYTENQPTNLIDPSGLQVEIITTCAWWSWFEYTYYPDGKVKSKTEIGPRFLVCTTTIGQSQHNSSVPNYGYTTLNPRNDPDNKKIEAFTKCVQDAFNILERTYHETLDAVFELSAFSVVAFGLGAIVSMILGIVTAPAGGVGLALFAFGVSLLFSLAIGMISSDKVKNDLKKNLQNAKKSEVDRCARENGITLTNPPRSHFGPGNNSPL